MTDAATIAAIEEVGNCIGCDQPILVGQPVTAWDDEIGHYNCRDPYSLAAQPEVDDDPETPKATILLGSPARSFLLSAVRAHLEKEQGK